MLLLLYSPLTKNATVKGIFVLIKRFFTWKYLQKADKYGFFGHPTFVTLQYYCTISLISSVNSNDTIVQLWLTFFV